jgi:hypothetical protein
MGPHAVRKKLRKLGLTGRITVQELAAALAADRQRPLRLKAVRFPPGHTGGVLVTPEVDVLCYPKDGWRIERLNAIGHELAHLLLGHEGIALDGDDALRMLAPNIDPVVVRRMLGRTAFTTDEERDAETTGMALVLDHLSDQLPDAEWFVPAGQERLVRRLLDSLALPEEP